MLKFFTFALYKIKGTTSLADNKQVMAIFSKAPSMYEIL
jgi:hypothetical protein